MLMVRLGRQGVIGCNPDFPAAPVTSIDSRMGRRDSRIVDLIERTITVLLDVLSVFVERHDCPSSENRNQGDIITDRTPGKLGQLPSGTRRPVGIDAQTP